jgi:hypothetical protein
MPEKTIGLGQIVRLASRPRMRVEDTVCPPSSAKASTSTTRKPPCSRKRFRAAGPALAEAEIVADHHTIGLHARDDVSAMKDCGERLEKALSKVMV